MSYRGFVLSPGRTSGIAVSLGILAKVSLLVAFVSLIVVGRSKSQLVLLALATALFAIGFTAERKGWEISPEKCRAFILSLGLPCRQGEMGIPMCVVGKLLLVMSPFAGSNAGWVIVIGLAVHVLGFCADKFEWDNIETLLL